MKLSLSEMERIDLIFFSFSRFLLWQNDILFIQPLKQKSDWWFHEGQIVFQPANAVSNRLNRLHKTAGPRGCLWRPYGLPFHRQSPLTSSILKIHTQREFSSRWLYFLQRFCPFLCVQLKRLVTFILLCWPFPGLTPLLGFGFISYQCQCAPGN